MASTSTFVFNRIKKNSTETKESNLSKIRLLPRTFCDSTKQFRYHSGCIILCSRGTEGYVNTVPHARQAFVDASKE